MEKRKEKESKHCATPRCSKKRKEEEELTKPLYRISWSSLFPMARPLTCFRELIAAPGPVLQPRSCELDDLTTAFISRCSGGVGALAGSLLVLIEGEKTQPLVHLYYARGLPGKSKSGKRRKWSASVTPYQNMNQSLFNILKIVAVQPL